jgi:MFS-type transporter involved in bile tolerance (Atg22 family)
MGVSGVIKMGLLVFLFAIFSSAFAPRLQAWLDCSNLRFLCLVTLMAQMIPLYATAGIYLPFGGFRTPMEMYFQAVFFGMVSDSQRA